MNDYYVENCRVLSASVRNLEISTQDCDDHGYLLTGGTNRGMYYGITPDGDPVLWMATNGDPVLVSLDISAADWAAICRDMADAPDGDIEEGYDRIVAARDQMVAECAAAGRWDGDYDLPPCPDED